MFITKKKYNEAIAKAIKEHEEKIWEARRFGELEEQLHRRMCHIEDRLLAIETKSEKRVENKKSVFPKRR